MTGVHTLGVMNGLWLWSQEPSYTPGSDTYLGKLVNFFTQLCNDITYLSKAY